MTKEARLTQRRLEGEIKGIIEGKNATPCANSVNKCAFCRKYGDIKKAEGDYFLDDSYYIVDCGQCPIYIGLKGRCYSSGPIKTIEDHMANVEWKGSEAQNKAIPGALAIYMWLYEL